MNGRATQRFQARRSRRGAAMVEAAVVMPVIIVFYGLFVFIYNRYTLQTTMMQDARHQAFTAALHQCDDAAHSSKHMTDKLPGYMADATNANHVRTVVDVSAMQAYVTDVGSKSNRKMEGIATNAPLSGVVKTRTVNVESLVYCVPREYGDIIGVDSNLASVIRYVDGTLINDVMGDLLRALLGAL